MNKMITDIDTARKLAEVFGDRIYNDLTIMVTTAEKEEKDEQT